MVDRPLERLAALFEELETLPSEEARQAFLERLAKVEPGVVRQLAALQKSHRQVESLPEELGGAFLEFARTLQGEGDPIHAEQQLMELLRHTQPTSDPEPAIADLRGYALHSLVSVSPTSFVFRARDRQLDRQVAIKFLSPHLASAPVHAKQFIDEARLASQISHPGVVKIFHVASPDEMPLVFFVMEWIDGPTLQQCLEPPNASIIQQRQQRVDQLIEAVEAIHRKQVIHRDLKPSNILLDRDQDRLVIIDFWLAIDPLHSSKPLDPAGTLPFMSPEQLQGQPLTAQSDLFSLGLIVAMLLGLRHPFGSDHAAEVAQGILSQKPRFDPLPPGIDPSLIEVLQRALAKDPSQRYGSAIEFGKAVRRVFPSMVTPVGRLPSSSQQRAWALPATLIGALLITLPWLLLRPAAIQSPQSLKGRNAEPSGAERARVLEQDGNTVSRGDTTVAASGEWIDANTFRMANGVELIHFPAPIQLLANAKSPPPIDERGPLKRLFFTHGDKEFLIGRSLVTQRQYLATLGELPAAMKGVPPDLDAPVRSVTYEEIEQFLRICNRDQTDQPLFQISWDFDLLFAAYVYPLLTGQATHEDLSRFASRPNPSHLDPIPIPDRSHAIQGVFGRYWEWTHRELRKPVQMNGAVDFSNSGEQLSRRQKVVIGSSQSHGFDHLFDCYYGINDHFQEMQGLQLHLETDQQTAYLRPSQLGERGYFRSRYQWDRPVRKARLGLNLHSFLDQASMGVRARVRSEAADPPLDQQPWREICSHHGIHQRIDQIDITEILQGAVEAELEYWLQADALPLHYLQFARSYPTPSSLPYLHLEIDFGPTDTPWIEQRIVPSNYHSPSLGFRLLQQWPVGKRKR